MVSLGPVPMTLVILLLALGVAALVARRLARRPGAPPLAAGGALVDMLLVGLVVGRLVFVVQWWPQYAADPWSLLRIGDGGYAIWAAVPAALVFGAWRMRARRRCGGPCCGAPAPGLPHGPRWPARWC